MLTHRFLISFISTICIYLVLGFLFFSFSTTVVGVEKPPEEHTLSFSLATFEPEVLPPIEEIIEEIIEPKPPEPIEEVVPEEVAEEHVVEEVVPEPLPEPIVEKVLPKPVLQKKIIKKEKVKKKIVPKKKEVKKKRVKKKKVVKKRTQKKIKPRKKTARKPVNRVSKREASPAKKNAFLSAVRAKINKNKTYPRMAQRRGMQGSVTVTFTILRNGQVSNIKVSGKKVFYKSARQAIKKSFPISVKNVPFSLPTTVNLTLRYQIR